MASSPASSSAVTADRVTFVEMMQHIDELRDWLTKEKAQHVDRIGAEPHIDHPIFSEREYLRAIKECRWRCKRVLEHVFGGEHDTCYPLSDVGLPEVLKPSSGGENELADGVLFTYVHLLADGHAGKPSPAWRDDFFYKGSRWSNPQLKRAFYYHFRPLERRLGREHNPILYLVPRLRPASPPASRYLRL